MSWDRIGEYRNFHHLKFWNRFCQNRKKVVIFQIWPNFFFSYFDHFSEKFKMIKNGQNPKNENLGCRELWISGKWPFSWFRPFWPKPHFWDFGAIFPGGREGFWHPYFGFFRVLDHFLTGFSRNVSFSFARIYLAESLFFRFWISFSGFLSIFGKHRKNFLGTPQKSGFFRSGQNH